MQVVPPASAIIPGLANAESVAIPADHLNMVKFVSCEDAGYEKVSGYLQLFEEQAPGAIGARWTDQDRIRNGRETIHSDTTKDFPNGYVLQSFLIATKTTWCPSACPEFLRLRTSSEERMKFTK